MVECKQIPKLFILGNFRKSFLWLNCALYARNKLLHVASVREKKNIKITQYVTNVSIYGCRVAEKIYIFVLSWQQRSFLDENFKFASSDGRASSLLHRREPLTLNNIGNYSSPWNSLWTLFFTPEIYGLRCFIHSRRAKSYFLFVFDVFVFTFGFSMNHKQSNKKVNNGSLFEQC